MNLTIPGVDFAWGTVDARAIKNAGFKFGIAYLSYDRTGKNWSAEELKSFRDEGLAVGFVWESTPGRALQGFSAGQADAAVAAAQARNLGYADAPICFAVDIDATDGQKPAIAAYVRGAASRLGRRRVGVYGSYYVIKYLAERSVGGFYWQTYAWSGGLVHPEACVLQYSNSKRIGGLSVDYDHASPEAFSLFLRGAVVQAEKPRRDGRKIAVWRHHLHEIQDVKRIVGPLPALRAAAGKLRGLIKR